MVLAAGGGGFQYYADTKQTETHLIDGGSLELAVRMVSSSCKSVPSSSARPFHPAGR